MDVEREGQTAQHYPMSKGLLRYLEGENSVCSDKIVNWLLVLIKKTSSFKQQ